MAACLAQEVVTSVFEPSSGGHGHRQNAADMGQLWYLWHTKSVDSPLAEVGLWKTCAAVPLVLGARSSWQNSAKAQRTHRSQGGREAGSSYPSLLEVGLSKAGYKIAKNVGLGAYELRAV